MEITETQPSMQWFVFFKDQLLLKKEENNQYSVPCGTEPPMKPTPGHRIQEVTLTDGKKVRALAVEQPIPETDEWITIGLRASYDYLPFADYLAAGKAYQILYWDEHSRFCPVCGMPMEQKAPIMKKCFNCGNEMYPPVSTAIIVLIRKGKEILLVHVRNFRGTFYGLVAGFLEAGETLEQCVQREVLEETGLRVKNITYFGNQPWPYPSGLMVGFIADYESGEIKLQDDELSAGAFYSKENLPEIPRKMSIARKLIDWWLENN
ncbi:MAG: NAD(+) diphosphatase [Bacteroides sp.]|nr:NAD(+) diphosphatase [Bacteroides sp.]